jgi:hypothetical protein
MIVKGLSTKLPRAVPDSPPLLRGIRVEWANKTVVTSFLEWRGQDLEL